MSLPKLRTQPFRIERLGLDVTIRELSGSDMEQIIQSKDGSPTRIPALVCKLGVVDWQEETVEAIAGSLGAATLSELSDAIYELTGVDRAKNSAPDRADASSSG